MDENKHQIFYVQPRYEHIDEQSSNINFVLEAVGQGQNAGFAKLKVMMLNQTSDMKTLLESVAKLDQKYGL
jgi:hypothetical protein